MKVVIVSIPATMHNVPYKWKLRFAKLVIVMGELLFDIKEDRRRVRFVFSTVRIGPNLIKGDIREMKLEFGQNIDVVAEPEGPEGSDYEHGTAQFVLAAADKDGNDVSGEFTEEKDPENELHTTFVRAAGVRTECFGAVRLSADGDPDADEEAPVVGTLDFNYDAPNVASFKLTGNPITPGPETPAVP